MASLIFQGVIKHVFSCFLNRHKVGSSLMLIGISFQALRAELENPFFGILQIIPRNMKISAESRVVAGVPGSSLEFVPDIF